MGSSPANFVDPLGLAAAAPNGFVGQISDFGGLEIVAESNEALNTQKKNGGIPPANVAGLAVLGLDVYANTMSCVSGHCFDYWQSAKNGNWYSIGWGGNGGAGGRNAVIGRATPWALTGKAFTAASVGLEARDMVKAYNNASLVGMADSTVDFIMIGVTVTSFPGFVLGGGYTVIDNTVGWEAFYNSPVVDGTEMCLYGGEC